MTTDQTAQTDQPVLVPAVGESVVVTTVNPDTASGAFRDWVLGREGIYDSHDSIAISEHSVRFADHFDPMSSFRADEPERRWVAGVQVITPGADHLTVGETYTGPLQRDLRCATLSAKGFSCSRPKHHGAGQHVASLNHNGEIVDAWPNAGEKPAPPQVQRTANGSPIMDKGARVIIRELYNERMYPERRQLHGLVGEIVNPEPDADGDIFVQRPDDVTWPVSGVYYVRRWDVAADQQPYVPAAGDRVKVVAVSDGATSDFAEYAIGKTATYLHRMDSGHRVRFDEPKRDATGAQLREWFVLRVVPAEPGENVSPDVSPDVTASEPDPVAEAQAKDVYRRLADAAVAQAAERQWCSEFEDIMREHEFEEVACRRQRVWDLVISFEYDLDDDQMQTALAAVYPDSPRGTVTDTRTTVRVEASVPWTGDEPRDLDTLALRTVLDGAGYTDFDPQSPELEDHTDATGEDIIAGVEPQLGGYSTWAERLAAFQTLIHRQASDRAWGEDLADVYHAAGVDRPRPEKITVEVTAKRSVYRTDSSAFGQAIRDAVNAPDFITLHRTLRFEIDNPHTDAECHCTERENNHMGNERALPVIMRAAVIDGARAQLRDLFPDTSAGWHADHNDVTLSCMWCKD